VKILEPLLGHRHTLWIYNSPELARQLRIEHSTDYVGSLTLEERHKGIEKYETEQGRDFSKTFGSSQSVKLV